MRQGCMLLVKLSAALLPLGCCTLWSNYVDQALQKVRNQLPPTRQRSFYISEPEACRHSDTLKRLRGFLHFVTSDWLTSAPSSIPGSGGNAASSGTEMEAYVKMSLEHLDEGYLALRRALDQNKSCQKRLEASII